MGVWLAILVLLLIVVSVRMVVLHNNRCTYLCPDCEQMYDPTETENFGRCPTCKTP